MLHLRVVPGFWVAVEEVRRPELCSHPVILGGLPHQRGVVREASFAAQQRGVQPGMPLAQAHQQCPEGIFLLPDLPRYEAVWGTVCDILRTYTPLVEPLEMGQAVVDLSGCERLWGDGLEAARAISAHIRHSTGIHPWLGVAATRLVAQLASTTVGTEGIAVIERGQEAAFLADLPLTLLPGLDPRLALTFQVLGLRTIGQLAALPAASVRERFGAQGERLHAFAHGIDPRPVVPPPEKPSVSAWRECEEGSIEEVVEVVRALSETCASELQRRHLAGTVVELALLPLPDPGGQAFRPEKLCSRPIHRAPPGQIEDAERMAQSLSPTESLPIPYRIHSMLPQPGARVPAAATASPIAPVSHGTAPTPISERTIRAKTVVRTPVDTASRLFETAQRLLLQHWPKAQDLCLHVVELRVSEFPAPKQLSFPELNRIGQVGSLAGLSAERLQALAEGEQVLATRYGDTSFRHITRLDPANILAERRFHWSAGLPWTGP